MPVPTEEQVLNALSQIQDPDLHRDIVSLGMIKDLNIGTDGVVDFTFELTTPACPVRDQFLTLAQQYAGALPGVTEVRVKMTSNVRPAFLQRDAGQAIPGVKQTIAVASGKGGVGKSTVATNLAAALAMTGASVGLLDADIYGPSIPTMLGTHRAPVVENEKLIPLEAHGLKLMSIGFLAGADKAMVWRGPLVGKAVQQFLTDVSWGELDYLIIDLPPGTGDASLTLAQQVSLSGVVIVATPQDVALDIAVKALQMFRTVNVTPLGLVENMSYYVCQNCGHEAHIFSHGTGEKTAQKLGVPFLGAVPLEEGIREDADLGAPVVLTRPDSAGAQAFREIAARVAAQASIRSFRQLPVINVR
ncbi:MAG: Mrp/NBP35 family ATP-binding protein [Chloroflexi bacterium]|nr:MAG: Mrp/NBP35 family ATP-binding protein [Chloroflexota bacterium]TMD51204.1 MAG: Mrp/NBP35 family ATP-binding protein [Chloroflexota bacterium]